MLIQGVKVCLFTVSENLLPRWVAVPSTYLSCISKNIRNNNVDNRIMFWIFLGYVLNWKEESILVGENTLTQFSLICQEVLSLKWHFPCQYSVCHDELCHSCDVLCVTILWYPIIRFHSHPWSLISLTVLWWPAGLLVKQGLAQTAPVCDGPGRGLTLRALCFYTSHKHR